MNRETTAGNDGDLMWVHATATKMESNYGQWNLELMQAGRYRVEVYTDTAFAQSKHAHYIVRASGKTAGHIIDQTAVNGWQSIGEYNFAAGADQWVHAGDNTGEAADKNIQLAFDAVRLTRVPDVNDDGDDGNDVDHGGCSATTGGSGAIWLLALVGVLRGRRRRRTS
jgi:MYXO-CTERM domain-containing protein